MGRSDGDRVNHVASRLLEAYDGAPIEPITTTYPDFTVDEAYAAQRVQLRQWEAEGHRIRGHKVGLTSKAMQRALGVGEPDFGFLLDHMVLPSSIALPTDAFLQPRIEPEIAFVLGSPIKGPGLTLSDVARSIESVVVALEVIDSRIADWKIKLEDTIADNASCGCVILGADFFPLEALDGRLGGCNLLRNGSVALTGATGAVMGHPLLAVQWLANTLGDRGTGLEAGDIVLSGACTAALPVDPGDTVTAVFAGLGRVTTTFAWDESPS